MFLCKSCLRLPDLHLVSVNEAAGIHVRAAKHTLCSSYTNYVKNAFETTKSCDELSVVCGGNMDFSLQMDALPNYVDLMMEKQQAQRAQINILKRSFEYLK